MQFSSEYGDDPSDFTKDVQFYDQLSDYRRFKYVFPHGSTTVHGSVNVMCTLSKSRIQ
jgi:hypothetical protein